LIDGDASGNKRSRAGPQRRTAGQWDHCLRWAAVIRERTSSSLGLQIHA
jgi:hypothetical protein